MWSEREKHMGQRKEWDLSMNEGVRKGKKCDY